MGHMERAGGVLGKTARRVGEGVKRWTHRQKDGWKSRQMLESTGEIMKACMHHTRAQIAAIGVEASLSGCKRTKVDVAGCLPWREDAITIAKKKRSREAAPRSTVNARITSSNGRLAGLPYIWGMEANTANNSAYNLRVANGPECKHIPVQCFGYRTESGNC